MWRLDEAAGALWRGPVQKDRFGRACRFAIGVGADPGLFVRPEWGRRGLGRGLLDECTRAAQAEGFRHLELGSTLPGVPFYSALGFEALEPLEITLADGVMLPIVRMRKAIGSA